MINNLQKVCLNIREHKITRKKNSPIQTLTKKDACVCMNNAANFTMHWQSLIRNKCVSDWCNKNGTVHSIQK